MTKYRQRLVKETTKAAKKAKLSKKVAVAQLKPRLVYIDSMLQQLFRSILSLN